MFVRYLQLTTWTRQGKGHLIFFHLTVFIDCFVTHGEFLFFPTFTFYQLVPTVNVCFMLISYWLLLAVLSVVILQYTVCRYTVYVYV